MSPGGGGLDAYRKKRDPKRTPEPFGAESIGTRRGEGFTPDPERGGLGGASRAPHLFVIQKHAARALHYDVRLEIGGTLKSWAVPKGPSVRHGEKRLAVHVEDHPVEYADFEGVIPRGNYGAGYVIVWDRGWYRSAKPESLDDQLARGRLEVELFGVKLRGKWSLVKTSRGRDWLMLKNADAYVADEELTERFPDSILSGLTVEDLKGTPSRLARLTKRLDGLRAPEGDVRGATQPVMLAAVAERPFTRPGWLFEMKYDGVRVLAERRGDSVELYGRAGQHFTPRYPEIVNALRALPVDRFVIDGELVALDEEGRPSFQRLQARMHLTKPADVTRARGATPVNAVFFDALAIAGRDLRPLPLDARKECLALLLPARGVARYGDHVLEQGDAFYEAASKQRIEGIVAKRASSAYTGGRSPDWIKIKCRLRQDFVIGGYTAPQGSRGRFGALHVGVYEGDDLVYAGRVGTGFDDTTLDNIFKQLQPLRRAASPFARGTPLGRGHTWVEPRLVAEVRFTEWTADGGIRHPAFLGLRADASPRDSRRERAAQAAPPPEVQLSNVSKAFWPGEGYTKGDLLSYYDTVAPMLLPYLRDRPLVVTRYPDGISGKSFYQKDAPHFAPDWIRTTRIHAAEADRDIDYFVVDDELALRYVINLGVIPLHLWGSRVASLDHPDWLILDLDPKGAPFGHVVRVALALRKILSSLKVTSFVKTSGATGLHILLPMRARYTWEEVRTFAQILATLGVEAEPRISTIARPIRQREGKVYIDWLQNIRGQTIVAPFSVRPLPGAPVSCPLTWDEVTPKLDPRRFTIVTVPKRFARRRDSFAPVLGEAFDIAAVLARLKSVHGE